jgi:GT2 family glycosyltransferase
MRFSVVIVNYGSWPFTLLCIDSLYKTGYEDFEILVVDNDQRPVPEMRHPVRLIRNPSNLGFARACNQGIAASQGEYVVLINPDTAVGADFFERTDRFFSTSPPVGVVGPRIVDVRGKLELSARRELSIASGFVGRTSLLTRLFPKSPWVKSQFPAMGELDRPVAVDWVSGACMILRRRVLEDVGLLDERFFMYFEDVDFCRRARAAGWLICYLPAVEVLHHSGGSNRSTPKAIWELHKSGFLYHRKHGRSGPLHLYSLLTLVGLAGRALIKLGSFVIRGSLKRSGSRRRHR